MSLDWPNHDRKNCLLILKSTKYLCSGENSVTKKKPVNENKTGPKIVP